MTTAKHPTLKPGAKGPAVAQMKTLLKIALTRLGFGYMADAIEVNEGYGVYAQAGVAVLQLFKGLDDVDAEVGDNT
jgi:hypothetical protein